MLSLEDLLSMDRPALAGVMRRGHALDLDALAESHYLGADLSLPPLMNRILWKTFRKTFHRDPGTGELRGWNVRMQQPGVRGPVRPMLDRRGHLRSFGHYVVRDASSIRWPKGLRPAHYLDYGHAGNLRRDPAALGATPLVAVNEGSMDLLLGWEVLRIAGRLLPLPDYWALERQGSLGEVVAPPRC
jgi:hypothetical protein